MSLLDTITGLTGLGSIVNQAAPISGKETQSAYPHDLVIEEGDAAYDTAAEVYGAMAAAGAGYAKIWEMTVSAQTTMRWGYGSAALPMNQGYMYFFLLDAGTGFAAGTVRLVQAKARETKSWVVAELNDIRLHTVTNTSAATATPISKDDMIALPEKVAFPQMGEDSLLQVWYAARSRPAAEDNAAFSIPCTIRQ